MGCRREFDDALGERISGAHRRSTLWHRGKNSNVSRFSLPLAPPPPPGCPLGRPRNVSYLGGPSFIHISISVYSGGALTPEMGAKSIVTLAENTRFERFRARACTQATLSGRKRERRPSHSGKLLNDGAEKLRRGTRDRHRSDNGEAGGGNSGDGGSARSG